MVESRKRSVVGLVKSNKADKTIVVEVTRRVQDPQFRKIVKRRSRFMAHDPQNECKVGDLVRIREHRPLSKNKRWILEEVVRKVVEV